MTIEINGMAHVILTVSRFEAAREFYGKLLPELGMKPVFDGDKFFPAYHRNSAGFCGIIFLKMR
jgi:catechol 2,3-dioxygenase-like lactoylglutathione lyase family enzyme